MKQLPALAAGLLAILLAAPAEALAAEPIMPLEQVRPGMACTALSVVRGTTISEFDAEVIDVIRGDSSSSGPRILIRVSGPAVEDTGIGPGFSGSPVICPDDEGVRRTAGAISEGLGEYGNEVGLATPIELVLGDRPEAPAEARTAPRLLRSARRLATPLTVTGLSAPMRSRVARAARRAGRPVLAAPSGPFLDFPVQDLRPGASMAVGFSSGDVGLSAIGTVTYRDGSGMWAFGHPLDALGRRSLLLQDAYVYTVVSNPNGFEGANSYKLAVPGHTVGSLTNDTFNAVIGRMGPPPRTIPVTVRVRDLDTNRLSSLESLAADEGPIGLGAGLEAIASIGLGQALGEALGAAPPRVASSMCVRIGVRELARPLGFCDEYLDGGQPFDDLSQALVLLEGFEFGPVTPLSVSVVMKARRGIAEAFILGARAPRRVRPGQRIRVRVQMRRRRGGRFGLSFRMRVPRTVRPGRRVLRLQGPGSESFEGGSLDALEGIFEGLDGFGSDDGAAGPRSLEALAARIRALGRSDGLRATFRKKGRGSVVLRTPRLLVRGATRVRVRVVRGR